MAQGNDSCLNHFHEIFAFLKNTQNMMRQLSFKFNFENQLTHRITVVVLLEAFSSEQACLRASVYPRRPVETGPA